MKYLICIFIFFAAISFTASVQAQDNFIEKPMRFDAAQFAIPIAGGVNSSNSVVRFSISGGASFQVYEVFEEDPVLKDYLKKLKRGYYIQSDLSYVFSKYFSVGLKYNIHKSSNEIVDVLFTDGNGNTIVGSISDDITIGFAGVVLNGRIFSENEKNVLNAGISVGTINYKDESVFLDSYTYEGNTIGMLYNLGYEYAMNEKFGVGLNFNYSFGTITTIEENGVEISIPGARIGTGRIQLGAIIILHF